MDVGGYRDIKGMFEGRILPVTVRLAFPIVVSNFVSSLFTIVDTYFITQIDKTSTALLSGPALIFPVIFLFLSLSIGLSTGISSLVSRGIGEKNYDIIERAADSGLLISLMVVFIIVPAGYLYGDKIVRLLAGSGLSDEAVNYGVEYLIYVLPGLGILLFTFVLYGVLQGEGLMKYIAATSIISGASNVILDPVFIFGLDMGVKGAALATSASYLISGLFIFSIFLRKKSSIPVHWKITYAKKSIMYEIVRVGFPESLGMLSMALSFMFLNNIVSTIGEAAMNSWALCGRLDFIIIVPTFAISSATITMMGQNYGRRNKERVNEIYRANVKYGILLVLFLAVIYNFIAPGLYGLFTSVSEVVEGAVRQVRAVSFTFAGVATTVISSAAFQATGRPIPSLVLRVLRLGVFVIPTAYILGILLNMGMNGVFIAIASGNILILVIAWTWTRAYLGKMEFRKIISE